jgi:hypothetical protein
VAAGLVAPGSKAAPVCQWLAATVPDLRRRTQDDAAVRTTLTHNWQVALHRPVCQVPGATAGVSTRRPASQVSRPVAIWPTNLNSAFRLRRSGTTETSLVSNLVTDLVTGHTCKRSSPNGKGPLTCDDVGSGGRI